MILVLNSKGVFGSKCSDVVQLVKEIKMIDFKVDEFFTFSPQESRFCVKIEKKV